LEIKADALGQIEFTSRLLARSGQHAFPQFGFSGELASASRFNINGAASQETKFQLLDENGRVHSLAFAGSTPGTAFAFPDCASMCHGRVEIAGARFRLWIDAFLYKTKKPLYIFLEGK